MTQFAPAIWYRCVQARNSSFISRPVTAVTFTLSGRAQKNAPMIFLSGRPSGMSGLDTNEVKSGTDFTFPSDTILKANFIRLDDTQGTDEFTFVFSRSPITTPAFFAGPSQHHLTTEELKQWQDFQAAGGAAPLQSRSSKRARHRKLR